MSNDIILPPNNEITVIDRLTDKAKEFGDYAFANNTKINYHSDWKAFTTWCQQHNLIPLPCHPDVLALYITALAEHNYKTSSIQRKICAISKFHEIQGHELNLKDKNFKLIWTGIRRKLGIAKKGKDPLLIKALREMIEKIPAETNAGIRDCALLTFGWASAMRRSELVALNWQDIQKIDEGMLVTIRQSKTDQFGEGQKVAVLHGRSPLTCPVLNLLKWQEASCQSGEVPIFTAISKSDTIKSNRLSTIDVARIVKKWVSSLGLDYTNFAGHSLRSGLITTAAKHSVPDHVIMKHTRHKSAQMLQVYTRDKSLVVDNVTSMVGL